MDKFYWTEKEKKQIKRSEWISKNGWIIQTIVSSVTLFFSIITLLNVI